MLTVGYDDDGNRTSLSAALGGSGTVAGTADFANAYAFDALDRLTQITQSGAAAGVADKGAAFGYDDIGGLQQIDRYASSDANFISSGAATPLATSFYDHDYDNRLKQLYQYDAGRLIMADYTWDYDDAARVTRLTGPGGEDVTFGYDDDDQLTSATSADTSVRADESYQYDRNGNRTSAGANTGYTTIADNRMDADGTYAYQYDGEGNPTLRTTVATGETLTYTWDFRNRLTDLTYTDAAGAVTKRVRYAYDADDRRIARAVDADGDGTYEMTEHYAYDPDGAADNVVLVTDGAGNVTHRLLQGPAAHQVLADEDLGKPSNDITRTTWLLADNQQSVRDVVDGAGTSLDHLVYDGYGNVVSQSSPTNAPRFTYTGMQADAATGLLYDFHRYYDPANGRFVSQDPKAFDAGGSNLYTSTSDNWLVASTGTFVGEALKANAGIWDVAGQSLGAVDDYRSYQKQGLSSYDSWVFSAGHHTPFASGVVEGYESATGESTAASDLGRGLSALERVSGWLNALGQTALLSATVGDFGQQMRDASSNVGEDIGAADVEGKCPEGRITCFVAGTLVLRGDGSETPIGQLRVGQRVATDGGVANSADGKSRAPDANATQVDRKNWRLVTLEIDAKREDGSVDVMDVQELMPLSVLRQEHAKVGGHLAVPVDLGDLDEYASDAIVKSISNCPEIEAGPGRVILTTITHLNDYVFHVTVTNDSGQVSTLDVTGFHRLYTDDRGWEAVEGLHLGEIVRGHPSEYPDSFWQSGKDFVDFKPNTSSGTRQFQRDINSGKFPANTQRLPYDPETGAPDWRGVF